MTADDVVAAARRWIGTPYVHQASQCGAGADCLGLLRGVWRDVLGGEPAAVPPYSPDWAEARSDEPLWHALADRMSGKGIDDEAPGDVILLRMRDRGVAKHLGFQARIGARGSFVHAYSGHGVIETSLSAPWQRRIVARFAFPEKHKG